MVWWRNETLQKNRSTIVKFSIRPVSWLPEPNRNTGFSYEWEFQVRNLAWVTTETWTDQRETPRKETSYPMKCTSNKVGPHAYGSLVRFTQAIRKKNWPVEPNHDTSTICSLTQQSAFSTYNDVFVPNLRTSLVFGSHPRCREQPKLILWMSGLNWSVQRRTCTVHYTENGQEGYCSPM